MSKQIQKGVNRSWSGLVQFPEREALSQTWGVINCVQRWGSQPTSGSVRKWPFTIITWNVSPIYPKERVIFQTTHQCASLWAPNSEGFIWDFIIATLSWWPLWVLPMSLLRYFSLHLFCQLLLVPQLGCCCHWSLDAHLGQCPHTGAPTFPPWHLQHEIPIPT